MRGRAVLVGLAAGLLLGLIAVVAGATAATRPAARLFVSAKEWSLVASRQSLASGPARIQLYNAGEDAHDLRLQRVGGTRALHIGATTPGNVTELRAVLRPGRWRLWCSLPGHAKAGMHAVITVKR